MFFITHTIRSNKESKIFWTYHSSKYWRDADHLTSKISSILNHLINLIWFLFMCILTYLYEWLYRWTLSSIQWEHTWTCLEVLCRTPYCRRPVMKSRMNWEKWHQAWTLSKRAPCTSLRATDWSADMCYTLSVTRQIAAPSTPQSRFSYHYYLLLRSYIKYT